MQESNIITISTNHPCYPDTFSRILPNAPLFYALGDTSLLAQGARLAIVGSRHPSSYGTDVTKTLTRTAIQAGITIVSGLALGIDGIAHRAALDNGGKTIAVLPSCIQDIYPTSHSKLAQQIVSSGGLLISEYAIKGKPHKYDFVKRNRLIAALADFVLVPEATRGSGSRHTIEFAKDINIETAFVPGAITSELSALPNTYIRDGAPVVSCDQDLLDLFGFNVSVTSLEKILPLGSNPLEQTIINALGAQNLSTDALFTASRLNASNFNTHLTMLEIKGVIEQSAAGAWRIV